MTIMSYGYTGDKSVLPLKVANNRLYDNSHCLIWHDCGLNTRLIFARLARRLYGCHLCLLCLFIIQRWLEVIFVSRFGAAKLFFVY